MKRREFLKAALAAGMFPSIVPARVLGADAPSNKLQIALIGCGRVASTMDLQGLAANHDIAMLTTLCDVDAERLPFFKQLAANQYGYYKKNVDHVKLEMDYRKVLDDPGVDGVMVCTQDHWHARMVVEACLKGKDVYVQKPMAFSVAESEAIVEAVRRTKRVFHIGTQQRTDKGCGLGFRRGVEYVLSGRLGKLDHIEVGIVDNSPKFEDPFPVNERMPDPRDFNFDLWLGPARDDVSYSQLRTHWRIREPNGSLPLVGRHGRYMNNGWLQIQDYCMGNICGWGSHHVDIAQWAMQNAAPISVKCEHVEFLKGRLFNVHDNCIISYKYANGVEMRLGTPRYSGFPCGCKFYGANGDWIWTSRGTTGRPVEKRVDTAYKPKAAFWRPCESNKKELIEGEPTTQVKRVTTNHHRPWFEAMRTRTDTHITVEEANVSTISCILGYIAMNEAGRTIGWDPVKRCFTNPDDQKRLYTRFARPQFSAIEALKEIRKRG